MKRDNANPGDPIRVYFLGSGRLAVPVLEALTGAPRVVLLGVGTQPDRAAGRRRIVQATRVGRRAVELGLPADKPESINTDGFLGHLEVLRPEIIVVAAFGQILRAGVLGLPDHGCLNVHASLLPRHRGASPASAAILAGDRETGISFMRMDAGLDTGPVYRQRVVTLTGDERAGALEAELGRLAAEGIVDCLVDVCRGNLQPEPQDDLKATHAPKLKAADGAIDWRLSATTIERMTRAFDPWPRAHFFVSHGARQRRIQITAASVVLDGSGDPGEVLQADDGGWVIACGADALRLDAVIPEGKREMTGPEFLRGAHLNQGDTIPGAHKTKFPMNVTGT